MHGLFQVAPNHACRCWKPIPAEIVGCFSLQDLLTGPACLFHFCAVQFRGKHPPSLEVQAKTLPPQHICSMVKTWYMVYGHSPSGIPDSGYINPYSWIDGKSFTMAQAHARETGESEDHLPPKKWVVLRRGTVHWGVSCLSALILTWTSSLRLQSQGFTTQSWCL